jgi:DivIVA domain-containing protein
MESKKLTSKDVADKRFTTVRMREGYSTNEVNDFMKVARETLFAYEKDSLGLGDVSDSGPVTGKAGVSELKERLENTLRELADEQARSAALQQTVNGMGGQLVEARNRAEAAEQAKAAAEASAGNALSLVQTAQSATEKPMDITGASAAVTRMIETAAKNYEDLVAQGEAEAKLMKEHAAIEAAEIRTQAEQEAAATLAQANAVKQAAFSSVEVEKHEVEASVAQLREIETSAREKIIEAYETALEEARNRPLIVPPAPGAFEIPDELPDAFDEGLPEISGDDLYSPSKFGEMPTFNG